MQVLVDSRMRNLLRSSLFGMSFAEDDEEISHIEPLVILIFGLDVPKLTFNNSIECITCIVQSLPYSINQYHILVVWDLLALSMRYLSVPYHMLLLPRYVVEARCFRADIPGNVSAATVCRIPW